MKRRLKRVEAALDESSLIQEALKGSCEEAGQFLTALRGESFGVKAELMTGLEEARIHVQLAKLLIEGIKVHPWIHAYFWYIFQFFLDRRARFK